MLSRSYSEYQSLVFLASPHPSHARTLLSDFRNITVALNISNTLSCNMKLTTIILSLFLNNSTTFPFISSSKSLLQHSLKKYFPSIWFYKPLWFPLLSLISNLFFAPNKYSYSSSFKLLQTSYSCLSIFPRTYSHF